jgi:imidazolonepropionase-like amidohydrolase
MKRFSLLAAVLLATGAPAAAETLVVTADRMVDVLAGRVVDEPLVVITDGRIVSVVGRGGARPVIPEGAKRIDLPGKTILPGLIDMHVHLDTTPLIGGYRTFQYTDAFWTALAVPHARQMLEAGFTTVRNVGARNYADVGLRQAIEGGFAVGPRIVGAGYSFGPTGGHCDENRLPPSYAADPRETGVDGPEAVRRKVRENRKFGAQVIKVCATGGVFSRNTDPGAQQMTEAELRAAVEEAHMLGMKVAAHAHGAEGIKAALRAGVDTIEHASFIDAEGIRLAREKGAFLSMDIYNTEYTLAEGAKNGVEEENLEKERRVGTIQRENFRKAHQAGARMVYGTDAGVYPHAQAGRQFAVMVRYGMTPMEAIQAATRNAAEALGREKDVGAIAPGRFGDIIAVDGDPLRDVRALEDVDVVIKGGEVVKQD